MSDQPTVVGFEGSYPTEDFPVVRGSSVIQTGETLRGTCGRHDSVRFLPSMLEDGLVRGVDPFPISFSPGKDYYLFIFHDRLKGTLSGCTSVVGEPPYETKSSSYNYTYYVVEGSEKADEWSKNASFSLLSHYIFPRDSLASLDAKLLSFCCSLDVRGVWPYAFWSFVKDAPFAEKVSHALLKDNAHDYNVAVSLIRHKYRLLK